MATKTKELEHDVTYNGKDYIITLEVTAKLVDESFSHEFGIESASGVEVIEMVPVGLWSVKFERELVGDRLMNQVADQVDSMEFAELFDYDEFY